MIALPEIYTLWLLRDHARTLIEAQLYMVGRGKVIVVEGEIFSGGEGEMLTSGTPSYRALSIDDHIVCQGLHQTRWFAAGQLFTTSDLGEMVQVLKTQIVESVVET